MIKSRNHQSNLIKALFVLILIVFIIGTTGWVVNAQDGSGGNGTQFTDKTQIQTSRFDQEERLRVIVQLVIPTQKSLDDLISPLIQNAQNELTQSLQASNVSLIHQFEFIPFMALEVNRAGFEELLKSPWVLSVEEDKENFPFLLDSVPLIRADDVWSAGYTGAGQVVAVLDTGVDKNHPAFAGKVVSEACYSSGGTSLCPGGVTASIASGSALPCSGYYGCDHGTHVAGIVAANGSVIKGVAKEAKLIAIQVFQITSSGGLSAYDSDIALGMERVFELRNDYNIAAVNLSLGSSTQYANNCDSVNSLLKTSIDELRSVGIATVIASGNEYSSLGISSPACISSAVSVGATTISNEVASYSNSAGILDLLAPGSSITSTIPGSAYGTKSGTSMATPHVAGAWALLKSAKPDATVAEILQAIKDTGVPITDTRNSLVKPRIDVFAALQLILTPTEPENLVASDGTYADKVLVTWDPVDLATQYQIYRDSGSTSTNATLIGNSITNSFGDTTMTGAIPGQLYYYWVKACNQNGCSDFSSPDLGWIYTVNLTAPNGVQASDGLLRDRVQVTWNGVGGADYYQVIRNTTDSTAGATVLSSNVVASPFDDPSASQDTEYFYWVKACNTGGCSPYSEVDIGYLLDDFRIFFPIIFAND